MRRIFCSVTVFIITLILLVESSVTSLSAQDNLGRNFRNLNVDFRGDSKIEIGSIFTGLSFHHSYPVPQRVSFYYPAANSIDLSTDYWFRDTTRVMNIGLQTGDSKIEWLDEKSMSYSLTPFSVRFHDENSQRGISVSYRFTNEKKAAVVYYTVTNRTSSEREYRWYIRYNTALRTSHTFAIKDNPLLSSERGGKLLRAKYDDIGTKNAEVFLYLPDNRINGFGYFSQAVGVNSSDKDTMRGLSLPPKLISAPAFNLILSFKIKAGKSVTIPALFGSCKIGESSALCEGLDLDKLEKSVAACEDSVFSAIENKCIKTGDEWLDKSVNWAQAILEVNRHYIDGDVVPMPCPAEYNFFFTHDVLLTDLAAVKFDLPRVKHDLEFILKHSSAEKIIPHAFYWKDSCYKTELADHDNWNNFWFAITASEYLKHSRDLQFAGELYPYVEKSIQQAMQTKGDDDLMWSFRPDWWDIGHLYGQRSYMTVLAIRALRSYISFSAALGKGGARLVKLEKLTARMQDALNKKLWSSKDNYLMNNLSPDKPDEHYYCGSLLAAHYGLLNRARAEQSAETAGGKLLEKNTGIFVSFPMDFDSLGKLWSFAGNEAGDKFYYMNGGIWPHANAWYALALMEAGMRDSAASFIRRIMTLNGAMNSPNGQPAMYEVRNGNAADPKVYGKVDKPQFTWAGGWYLYSLYYLYALKDNEWNITFSPWKKQGQREVELELNTGGTKSEIKIIRQKELSLSVNGKKIPSLVLPETLNKKSKIMVGIGPVKMPILASTNSFLSSISYSGSKMVVELRGFSGHDNVTTIFSPRRPKSVTISGKQTEPVITSEDGCIKTEIRFIHEQSDAKIEILF